MVQPCVFEQFGALFDGVYQFYIHILLKHHPRMWEKSQHHGIQIFLFCGFYQTLQNGFVANMHAIKSADCDHTLAGIFICGS